MIIPASDLIEYYNEDELAAIWLPNFAEQINQFIQANAQKLVKGEIVIFQLIPARDKGLRAQAWAKLYAKIQAELERVGYSVVRVDGEFGAVDIRISIALTDKAAQAAMQSKNR